MGTTPDAPEPVPTRRQRAVSRLDSLTRTALAGSSVGAVRRIGLYLILVLALAVMAIVIVTPASAVAVVFALVATFLLAVTDKLA
jgi:Flp pilus assembly protein TadB